MVAVQILLRLADGRHCRFHFWKTAQFLKLTAFGKVACENGHLEVVKLLLLKGANIEVKLQPPQKHHVLSPFN